MNEIRVIESPPKKPLPETTSEERTWAALAHASAILTLVVGLPTAGLGGLLFVFVPFAIYLAYKDKSRFVAYHAAQAFALQLVGTIGFFLAIIVGAIALALVWVVTGVLIVILIGLILIPVSVLLTVLFALLCAAFPFILGGFSIVGAIETASGRDYRYPYVGKWVEDWLGRYKSEPEPAV